MFPLKSICQLVLGDDPMRCKNCPLLDKCAENSDDVLCPKVHNQKYMRHQMQYKCSVCRKVFIEYVDKYTFPPICPTCKKKGSRMKISLIVLSVKGSAYSL